MKGTYKATFTGDMQYNISTDNGYKLTINNKVVEEVQGGNGMPRMGGFGRGGVQYKSFPVKAGETYDVMIEYKRGTGNFAMMRAEICERKLAEFTDLARELAGADVIIMIGGISARMEGEGGDKADIELPRVQQRLMRAMHSTGKPVVMVNCSGSAIAFGSVRDQYSCRHGIWAKVAARHWPTCCLATTTLEANCLSHSITRPKTCPTSSITAWTTALTATSVALPSTHSATDCLTRHSALVKENSRRAL